MVSSLGSHGNAWPMANLFHSTLLGSLPRKCARKVVKKTKKQKTESMRGLDLLKSCVLPARTRKGLVKKNEAKNYRFKMVSTAAGLKLKSEVGRERLVAKKRLPRTSSFNSNGDERDNCNWNDFEHLEQGGKPMGESFLPAGVDKNGFNNLGDFLVWYV